MSTPIKCNVDISSQAKNQSVMNEIKVKYNVALGLRFGSCLKFCSSTSLVQSVGVLKMPVRARFRF